MSNSQVIFNQKAFKVCHINKNYNVEFFDVDRKEKSNLLENLAWPEKTLQIFVIDTQTNKVTLDLRTDEDFKKYKEAYFESLTRANSPICGVCLAMVSEECNCAWDNMC